MTDLIDRPASDLEELSELSEVEPPPSRSEEPAPIALGSSGADRGALGAFLAAAGLIHLVMAPSHLDESAVEGVGFLVAAWLQLGLAVGVVLQPRRWMLRLAVGANLALVGVWAWSRTAGLPFGDHANHAETVSIVDGSAVALEVMAIAMAVLLLRRVSGLLRVNGRAFGLAVPVAAFALASAAVASPSARNHAVSSHDDHMTGEASHSHGADAGEEDDRGLSLLDNGHQHGVTEDVVLDDATQAQLAVQLAGTAPLIARYPTVADAEAAGYRRGGPFVPGLGAHYFGGNPSFDRDGDLVVDPEEMDTPVLIYDGIEPDSPLAGFMYYQLGEETPEGFAGDSDIWHHHTNVCMVYRADGSVDVPFGSDLAEVDAEMCAEVNGQLTPLTGQMLHVWTVPGYESSRGVFSEVNPAITCPNGDYYTVPPIEYGNRDSACRNL